MNQPNSISVPQSEHDEEYTLAIDDLLDGDDEVAEDGFDSTVDEESALTSTEELASRVRRLVELRARRDETKIAADTAKREFEEYQALFFEEYERSPLKGSIKIDVGGEYGTVQIVPRKTQYGRILDRDKAVQWMREHEKEDEYVKDDFRMGRIHELVREHMEQKKPLPPGFDFYTKEYFTVTFKD